MEVLWPMDRTVDGGEGQPGPELGPGGSCGVPSIKAVQQGAADPTGLTSHLDRSDRSSRV